jgi:hypothetical protein
MGDNGITGKTGDRPWRRLFFHAFAVASVVVFSFYVLFRILLLTPLGANLVERILSEYTGRAVTVGGFFVSGGTVLLDRVAIESPAGFPERRLLSARSISITPDPMALLTLKKSFSHIGIDGLRIDLAKNPAGTWNFSGLLDRFTRKKPKKAGETFIRRLHIEDATLRVNGYGFDRLGLDIDTISTQGSTESKVEISGKDPAGNPVRLTAEGRMGSDPAFRVRVRVPAISLSPAWKRGGGRFSIPDTARFGVSLAADFRHGVLDSRGTCGLNGFNLNLGSEKVPLQTSLAFTARWDTRRDEAILQRATLSANDILTIRASGSILRIRQDGIFSLKFLPDPIRLGAISRFFPEKSRRGFILDGTLTSSGGYLEGSRREGITGGKGDFFIRSASLSGGGRTLFRGGGADIFLGTSGEGWLMRGKVYAAGATGTGALLESIEAPFSARFSPRFRPVRMESHAVRAVAMGVPVQGWFQYTPSLPQAFSLACSADASSLASLNSRLPRTVIRFASGTGKATARLSGSSVRDFTGSVTAVVASSGGTIAGEPFSLGTGRFTSEVRRSGGRLSAKGELALAEGTARGKKLGASLGYSLANEVITVRNGDIVFGGAKVGISSATVRLPLERAKAGVGVLPLAVAFAGVGVRAGDVSVAGLSGRIGGRLFSVGSKRRLEGTADLALQSVSFRGQQTASLAGRVNLTGSGATATIKGDSLGGKLDATIRSDFSSRERATSFSLQLQDQRLERVQGFLPTGTRPRLSGGSASLSLSGTYARQTGIHANLSGTGSGISLAGEGNRTLVSDLGMTIDSRIAGENLSIKEAVFVLGQGVTARAAGDVERFTSADRKGSVTFALPTTRLNTLLDAFANSLPRSLQEAVCEGTCSLEGIADIKGREVRIRGGLALDAASLEIPSQKVQVTGISGNVPISLYIPGKGVERKTSVLSFSRENFPKLLQTLGGASAGTGAGLRIGTLRFGALETGPFTLFMTADQGVLHIVSINGSLYDGRLLGSGFLLYGNGLEYGADLLVNDLSLKQFCESFPAIKGYITGRVDGVVSLLNVKGGIGGLAGYVDLWTRSVKGEKMSVSKEFLQKLAGKKLRGFLFTNDRAYDTGEISAFLRGGFLTFEKLDISHTNFLGMKDLSVTVVPVQNRISLEHLMDSIRQAAARGKAGSTGEAPVQTDLKWLE